jgi:glycosyltransferase involved in cell wall biosynthesis
MEKGKAKMTGEQMSFNMRQDPSLLKPRIGCDVGLWKGGVHYTKPTEAVSNAADIIIEHRKLREQLGDIGYQLYVERQLQAATIHDNYYGYIEEMRKKQEKEKTV